MALSGSRLATQLQTDYLAKLLEVFPINTGLLPAEITAANAAMTKLAQAFAVPGGPDIVTEFVSHAVATVPFVFGVTPGSERSGVSGEGAIS